LLGVTLAELAIGHEVLVSVSNDAELEFKFKGKSESTSKEQILHEAGRASGAALYRNAIRACFEFDARIEKRGQRIEDIKKAIEKILKPSVTSFTYNWRLD
jgi:hypothetical protein